MTPLSRRTFAMAVVFSALTLFAACSSPEPAATKTAAVERVAMAPGISSTGSLSAATEQNLGFAKGGQLTTVTVKVGDKVEAGQVLATIDPVPARQALAAQKAQLRATEAQLDKLDDSPAVDDAEDTLSQAKDVLEAVREQVSAQDEADRVAVYNAQQQLAADGNAKSTACNGGSPAECSAATQKVVASQSALSSAEQKRDLDQASGQVSIENAQQSVTTARNTVDLSKSDRPHSIDQQEALVSAARAAVDQAERDLANTTLRAPAAGTVTALNGAVGEYVAASTGTSALAPGTDASIPGASGASNGGSPSSTSGSTVSAASVARPGGSQFLVLSDIDQLQVVALFNESDAASLTEGQTVDVTLDALPDLTLSGKVASVAPSGTAVSGVISYYVTVNLDDSDPRLKAGQTATVSISTGAEEDVLTVPSAAVHTLHGRTAVTVVEGDTKRDVTFEAGAVNDGRTEVISGLREGQRVTLPTGTTQGGSHD
jgi:HlyD family secretion protein